MLAVKSINAGTDFREWCKRAVSGETVIVSNPAYGNVVMLSEGEYNKILKAKQNAEYMEELDIRSKRLANGEGIHKTIEELEAMEYE